MDQVSKLKFWEEISNNKRIYLTSDELSGLAHIPSKGSVNLDSIVWVNVPPSRIPPFVEKFEPLSYEEKLKIRKDLSKHRTLFRQELEKNFGGDNNE